MAILNCLQIRNFFVTGLLKLTDKMHANQSAECINRLSSLVTPATAPLSHRQPTSAYRFCDSCRA
jgi:hypothetical protein